MLAHIRTAARSRLVAPDAVLGSVLTRIAAISPHSIELPPIVGSPMGLTLFVAIVGPPEAGKSASTGVATELVVAPGHVVDGLPIGSGEGLVEVLFEVLEEPDETGKMRKVKRQTRHAALFRVDEGSVVADMGGRNGATLLATLRTAWTHGTLGATNATVETRRILDGRSYVYGLVIGLQPAMGGALLADVAAGTPQRFVWCSATDPGAPDEVCDWPGELGWQAPAPAILERLTVSCGGWRRHRLAVDQSIVAEVRAERLGVIRGEAERSALDAHSTLGRLKISAVLALLDGRCDVNVEDWYLAQIVSDTSRRVRESVEAAVAAVAKHKEDAATRGHARREHYIEDSREQRALMSAAKSVGRLVARHCGASEHDGAGCGRACLTRGIAGKHRQMLAMDEVISKALDRGWIVPSVEGGRYVSGETVPS